MTLITPVLIFLARRAPLLLLVSTFSICIFDFKIYLIIRNQILLFYVFGLFFACYKFDLSFSGFFIGVIMGLIFIGVSLAEIANLYGYGTLGYYYDSFIRRPFMVVFSWFLCEWIARSSLCGVFVFLERYVFSFFLSHVFIFTLMGGIFYRLEFLHNSFLYAIIWLVAPVVAYFLVVMVRIIWVRFFGELNVIDQMISKVSNLKRAYRDE